VTVLEGRNLRTIDPAGTQPAESKDDFVKNDDCDRSPVRSDRGFVRRQCGENNVDDHANTASKSRPRLCQHYVLTWQVVSRQHSPDHHGTTTDFLNVPDWRVGCEGESGVEDTSEDTRKKWREVEIGEDLGREIYQHVDTKELLCLIVC
jgi:hypothetical protein